jgi:preprotein translocase subunit SecA
MPVLQLRRIHHVFRKLRGVRLCSDRSHWFLRIEQEIEEKRQEGRPVMVFFEDLAVLEEFYKRPTVERLRPLRLDERVSTETRPSVVARAVSHRVVTLLTRDFGRGTDFLCEDPNIDKRGGVHVIQTFVSDELSEEKQIQGPSVRPSVGLRRCDGVCSFVRPCVPCVRATVR